MKRIFCIAILLLVVLNGMSQDITILEQGEARNKLKSKDKVYYLEDEMDTSVLPFVATLQMAKGSCPCLLDMYNKLETQAKKLGANAFRVSKYEHLQLTVKLYYLDKDQIEQNIEKKDKNVIYVFAGESSTIKEYANFQLNGDGMSVRHGHYFRYKLKEGEQVRLHFSSLAGTVKWIKWSPDRLASYLSLADFYNEPVVKRTTTTKPRVGDFKPVDRGLGDMLIHLLSPTPKPE